MTGNGSEMAERENARVVGLESAPCLRVVGLWQGRLELAGAGREEVIVAGHGVDGVAHPRMPAGLDVGGVVVVLGVLDPTRAQGQLLQVLKVLVAGAILAHELSVLGITCR